LFTRYEKKEENDLGLVQLANSLIVYRRIILGYTLSILLSQFGSAGIIFFDACVI
jgi:hypothetical protein